MVDVIEKARKRLTELESEAERLRTFISVYEALETSDSIHVGDSAEAEIVSGAEQRAPSRAYAKPKTVIKHAKAAIQQRGRPMTRTELVRALEDRGLVIGGTDKSKNMGTILWRSKQFENIEGEGYWPSDAPAWGAAGRQMDLG